MPDPYRISSIFFDTLYHEIDMEISYFLTYHTLRYVVYKGIQPTSLLGEEDVGGGMSCYF